MTPNYLLSVVCSIVVGASVGGDIAPDGSPAQVILPQSERMHNTGGSDGPRGPGSGSGLCVFTSAEHAGRYQGGPVEVLRGLQKWMTQKPGGGYPEKFDKMIAAYCKEKGVAVPRYIQVTNGDLDVLVKACQSRRMPCITYIKSPSGRYNGQSISHMVNCVNAGQWWGILDNNYPEEIEWLTTDEFRRTYLAGTGWSIVFLDSGPPPALRVPTR